MRYKNILSAVFLSRPNRFVARVLVDGRTETVHVKNTGRCRELLIPGARVMLTAPGTPGRKLKYDLVSVYKTGLGWVNIDSQAPNAVVKEWLMTRKPFPELKFLKPEYIYGDSRMDFYLECPDRRILMEVKGCTLERQGVGYFPDAPTQRGVKHLHELCEGVAEGYECYLSFVIALPGVEKVLPNTETHPAFAAALSKAENAGVRILYLPCRVTPDCLEIIPTDTLKG